MNNKIETLKPTEPLPKRRFGQRNIVPQSIRNRLLTNTISGSQIFKVDTVGGWVNIGQDQPLTNLDPNTILYITKEINGYLAVNFENVSSGPLASTDFVLFNDVIPTFDAPFTEFPDTGYIDIGVTSSNYADPQFATYGANAEYIWTADDFYIGIVNPDHSIKFFFGGADSTDYIKIEFNSQGVIIPLKVATADAPDWVEGGIYYDTTLKKMMIGGQYGWETVTSA